MFVSFFPRPRLFFLSAALWALAAVLFWFFVAKNAGHLIGLENPPEDAAPIIGLQVFWSKPFLWFYLYYTLVTLIFAAVWYVIDPHRWFAWSVLGSALIIFLTYYWVEVGVAINSWYGPFGDLIQASLSKSRTVTAGELYSQIGTFLGIALVAVTIRALTYFFTSHFVFRWRTAMTEFYVANWPRLRGVEGAAQRVQEDTMRFADSMESLGVRLIDAVMTLIAFTPLLVTFSEQITELPVIGHIPKYSLVMVALGWALFGTGLLALVGIKLPGLEFRNQRVEAAFRKELVFGEEDAARATPPVLHDLFAAVRKNYFRLYFHYVYFNITRLLYLQIDNIVPTLVMVPSLAAGKLTLGLFNQITNAFSQVRDSFQYLVNVWPDIIKMISIFKRLRAFESVLHGDPLSSLDLEGPDADRAAGAA